MTQLLGQSSGALPGTLARSWIGDGATVANGGLISYATMPTIVNEFPVFAFPVGQLKLSFLQDTTWLP